MAVNTGSKHHHRMYKINFKRMRVVTTCYLQDVRSGVLVRSITELEDGGLEEEEEDEMEEERGEEREGNDDSQ